MFFLLSAPYLGAGFGGLGIGVGVAEGGSAVVRPLSAVHMVVIELYPRMPRMRHLEFPCDNSGARVIEVVDPLSFGWRAGYHPHFSCVGFYYLRWLSFAPVWASITLDGSLLLLCGLLLPWMAVFSFSSSPLSME
ncbi:hypothetical protein SUGI_0551810 [Cryptomeria japonica]|nr:hypothetical protein SUGI_0551810 [Cryptomeria japonica]